MNSSDEVTGPMNLGNPCEFTILELAQKIIAMTRSKSTLELKPLNSDDPGTAPAQYRAGAARPWLDTSCVAG
jgi:hypothetical protein